ncbi:MAG: hypothetical protein KDA98_17420 [Acidimicrobiales bacterium]|nr:hypothetical protein [Acidimicrobiales bacterium]
MDVLLILALAVAVVSAIRGIWSPCGLSMLSSITPMTEAGRGNRFGVTAGWFLAGGIVGGLTTGLVAAAGAALVALADPSDAALLGVAAVVASATAAIDLGITGIDLPIFKRQVNDAWLRRYRAWVYGAGFGWQIGTGVATYIMTAGVFLTFALAVLTASPAAALAIGLTFGVVRGSAVYLGRSATTPTALNAVHERLDRFGPAARAAAAGIQVLAAVVAASLAWSPLVGLGLALAAGAATLVARPGRRAAAA